MSQIVIDLSKQRLLWQDRQGAQLAYPVSTAKKGAGEQLNSYQTPRGRHRIRAKIGAGLPSGAILVGRRWTGEIYTPAMGEEGDRDWILSRILWLSGLEVGLNRLGSCDTFQRMIYIHGTPDSEPMGVPKSHGCIRMRNDAVIDLFDRVDCSTEVWIHE